jgi:hypothetical protein
VPDFRKVSSGIGAAHRWGGSPMPASRSTSRASAYNLSMPKLRFSLRAFLLLLFIGSLVASNLFTSWQLHQLRQENAQLRKELGRLVVSDPQKLSIIAVPSYEDMLWRWRIYVPKGQSVHIHSTNQDIPLNGFPAVSGSSGPMEEGEYLLTAAIRPNRNGDWQITVAGPHASFSIGIANKHAEWLSGSVGYSTEQAGTPETQVSDLSQPMVLLRVRAMKQTAPGSSSTTPEPSDGVLLWLTNQ